MKKLVLALCFAVFSASSHADWRVSKKVDSMTDEVRVSATTTNSTGHELAFYRVNGGSLWANFSLPNSSADVLSDKAPIYRIDKNQPVPLDDLSQLNQLMRSTYARLKKTYAELGEYPKEDAPEATYEQQPKWVNWRMGALKPELLEEFKTGSKVVVRYFLFTGGYKETVFSLSGSAKAVNAVIANN